MELRQLKYFLAVAEDLHFGKAARRMNISQPPLSQQIKQLEDELGAKLFERTSRSVVLTPEGDFLMKEAQSVLDKLDKATKTVRAIARGEEGQLTIGFVVILNQSQLPRVIRDFRSRRPNVRLELKEMSTNSQLSALASGDLDIGFIRAYGHKLNGFHTKTYLKENYVLALPDHHPLAGESKIRLSDLTNDSLIMFNRGYQPDLFDSIIKKFTDAGVKPRMIQETNRRLTAIALVAAGMGVSPVPESTKRLGREGVVYLPIADPLPAIEVIAVWPKNRQSHILDSFVQVMDGHLVTNDRTGTSDRRLTQQNRPHGSLRLGSRKQ